MKVNKTTIYVCLFVSIMSGMLMLVFKENNIIQSTSSGIFTGFIASLVISVIGYFNERAKLVEGINTNIKSLFLNITVMSKILGTVSPQIHNSCIIPDLPFKNLCSLSQLNLEFMEKMNLGLYSPFFPGSKKGSVCKRLQEFQQATYNIKNCSMNLENAVLNYNIQYNNIQIKSAQGIAITREETKNLEGLKNSVNIFAAKLHEYTTGQAMELGKIAKDFYGYKKKRLYWNDLEAALILQAESIVKGR